MKNENRVIIGIIVVATVLLVILYSPWGSPGNYIENCSYGLRTGVNFSSRIENGPREVFSNSYGYSESSVPYAESGYLELRGDLHSPLGTVPETHLSTNYAVNSNVHSNKIAVTSSSSGFAPTAVYNVTKTQSNNNINSNNNPVLKAILSGTARQDAGSSPLAAADIDMIANALVARTTGNNTASGQGPLRNPAELVGRYIGGSGTGAVFHGFSEDIAVDA
ncbi:MAG: hypothetical protein WCJ61_09385, partial [Paludibacter sp.]